MKPMEWRRKKLFYSKIMKKGPFCRISNFVLAKDPDIIICMRDYYNGTLFYCLFTRAKKHGVDLQLGGEIDDCITSPPVVGDMIKAVDKHPVNKIDDMISYIDQH
jgi:hypothetical protein